MNHIRTIAGGALLVLLGIFCFGGCHSATGTISRDPVAYFEIKGVAEDVAVAIDGGPPSALQSSRKPVRIQVAPGRHRVQVTRSGTVVVDRTVYVTDEQILEVSLP